MPIRDSQKANRSLTDNADGQASFQQLTDGYRYELLIHCYRILGSIEDAEDGLQETLLRAWRRFDTLNDLSSVRAWLYRIATNVSLDMLDKRKSRSFPTQAYPPADPQDPLPELNRDDLWLDPLPEFYADDYARTPEQQLESLENVSLAFLVALQRLPGRQRAILILCDVLDWKTREVADTLDTTVAAVNSALQRARGTLKKEPEPLSTNKPHNPDNVELSTLLMRYVDAWESADIAGLMALLHEDAQLTMPPLPTWYRGHADILAFFEHVIFAESYPGDFRLMPTRSNGSPAFAVYQRDQTQTYRLAALHILTIRGDVIVQIDDFLALDQALFARFKPPQPD